MSLRLKALRENLGLTQEQLAVQIGFTRSYVSQIEAGAKEPGRGFVNRIAQLEHEGVSTPLVSEEVAAYQVAGASPYKEARAIALLSWNEARDDKRQTNEEIVTAVNDPRAYAVRIKGDAMAPRFLPGDIAVLSPSSSPRAGQVTFVRTTGGDLLLRIWQITGRRVLLSCYNPAYPSVELDAQEVAWAHCVTQVISNL